MAASPKRVHRDARLAAKRYQAGRWAFLFHRITGLLLVFYLFLHILVISSVASKAGPKAFNAILATLQTPLFIWADIGLIGIVIFHGLNGIRILLFDFGFFIRKQKEAFWVILAVGSLLWAWVISLLLPLALGQ